MLKQIAACALFILGLLTMTFFRHYTGDIIPYPWLFFLAGIGMLIIGYILLRSSLSRKETAARKALQELITDLKENGQKLTVDLRACEVRGNDYAEKTAQYDVSGNVALLMTPTPVMALMYLIENTDTRETVEVQQSVFIYKFDNPKTGEAERFLSPVIPKDELSLSVYLETQKTTTLYIDKTNRNRYYFDLDFLFRD